MPHRSFGAARIAEQREPITFDFGLYSEEQFTVVPDPSLGDVFDLSEVPEGDFDPEATNYARTIILLSRFIRRMIRPEDQERFDKVLYRIPSTQSFLIVEVAQYIAEAVVPIPSQPLAS